MAKNNYRGKDAPGGTSGFVAIDETDGIGDGGSYSQPVSSGKQNRIQGNTMYLAAGPVCTCFTPVVNNSSVTAATGDRPWASIEWSSVGLWLIPMSRGFAGVRLGGIYNVMGNGTNLAGARLKVQLGPTSQFRDLPNTDNGGPQYKSIFPNPEDGDFTIEPITDDNGGFIPLFIWIQSRDDGPRSGATVEIFGRNWYVESRIPTTVFDNSTSGNPFSADSMETQYLRTTDATPFIGKRWDILHNVNGINNEAVTIYPADAASNDAFDAQMYYQSFVQFRGLFIKPIYQTRSIADLPQSALEGQLSFSGPIAQRQARATTRLFKRPRLLKVGPEGVLSLDANFERYSGVDYAYRWPFVDGDSGTITLIEDSVFLDAQDPIIHLEILAIATAHRQPLVNALIEGTGLKASWSAFQGLPFQANYDPENPGTGKATWTLELKVDLLDDVASPGVATWENSTTNLVEGANAPDEGIIQDVEMTLYSAAFEAREVYLRQQAFMEANDPGFTDYAFSYKEGQLWASDLGLVTRIPIEAKLDGFDEITDRPVRVRVDVNLNTDFSIQYPSAHLTDPEFLRFAIVGYTISQFAVEEK